MKKQFWPIVILILVLVLPLCACGTAAKTEIVETTIPAETATKTTEPEIEPDPEWLSETAIDEAYACLFPLDGEKNIELAQEILFPLVEAGNAEAQYYWGYIHDWEIVDNNGEEEKESLYWYELAADQGFPKAYLAVSLNAYIESEERANEFVELAKQAGLFDIVPEELGADGCAFIGAYYADKKDYSTSFEWNLKAAELGSTPAMLDIGLMYYNGAGVEKDIGIALDWLLKAANQGNVYAMNYYGFIFFDNNCENEIVNKKYTASLDEYQKDAEAGDPIAMHNLGQMYENELGNLRRNRQTAFDWYLKAANLGDAYSMYRLGDSYRFGFTGTKDYESAMEWYLKAADLGIADAMEAIGVMYSQGWGVESDNEKAQEWWKKAEEARRKRENDDGHIDYFSDVNELREDALELFKKAADAGYIPAIHNMGYYGYDVGMIYLDEAEARNWYHKAADEGHTKSMAALGYSYYTDSSDYDEAMKWFLKAYANGYDTSEWINYMLSNKQGVNAYFENYGELIAVTP